MVARAKRAYADAVLDVGADKTWGLPDGRTLEYWDGGDPQGRLIIMHPGTPAPCVLGRWGHRACAERGVRLVALNRPGYGRSTALTNTRPSLLQTGRETAEFAAGLGVDEYAVMGISGGGPFATATAIADSQSVRVLAVLGPVGEGREISNAEERRQTEAYEAGDTEGAWQYFLTDAEQEMDGWRDLDDEARVDLMFQDDLPGEVMNDKEYRAIWAVAIETVLRGYEGWVFDGLAWSGRWDINVSDVKVPTLIFDAEGEGAVNGTWYAEKIPGSQYVAYPGEGHIDACDGHWPEVIDAINRTWV